LGQVGPLPAAIDARTQAAQDPDRRGARAAQQALDEIAGKNKTP